MNTMDARKNFVKGLQEVVRESQDVGANAEKHVGQVVERLSADMSKLDQQHSGVKLQTEQKTADGRPALRVTCPTRTVISADVPDPVRVHTVEFYLTRPRQDGIPETRLIGTSKYPDGDGRWGVTFSTERFTRRPTDSLLLHAEVLDENGRLLAAGAIAPAP